MANPRRKKYIHIQVMSVKQHAATTYCANSQATKIATNVQLSKNNIIPLPFQLISHNHLTGDSDFCQSGSNIIDSW